MLFYAGIWQEKTKRAERGWLFFIRFVVALTFSKPHAILSCFFFRCCAIPI
jgi:hypothetical protein